MSELTHSSIIPLIGGMTLGVSQALSGKLPEYIVSYSTFTKHDDILVNYLTEQRKHALPYTTLDTNPSYRAPYVDIVSATCPCAGLSSFSVKASEESGHNDWLYNTAQYVLDVIKPKAFLGENAPRLYLPAGSQVASELYNIGKKYGYSLTIYHTESRLHGLSQLRGRSFYVFIKNDKSMLLSRYNKKPENIESIFEIPIKENDAMNETFINDIPSNDPWVQYCMHMRGHKTIQSYYTGMTKTERMIDTAEVLSNKFTNGTIEWFESKGYTREVTKIKGVLKKLGAGLGYWSHGPTIGKGEIPSLIGHMPIHLIDAQRDRYMTLRDCLRIMKMPDDFNIHYENPTRHINKICQNVPVSTAADIASDVVRFCQRDKSVVYSTADFVRQSNKTGEILIAQSEKQSRSLY